jgi:formylglycine-generating enzyme required for sulfatase activity
MRAWAADALGRAARAIEPALLLAPDSADVRGRFADVLYERALLAERMDDARGVDDMLARLPLYDRTGERTRLWSAPATVTIASDPPGADLVLERYEPDPDGRLVPVRVDAPERTPVARLQLPPGSWRLTFSAPGRVAVRMPFFLRRGGTQDIAVSLPLPGDVPDGFEYVPQGRFLYGSSAPDDLRRGFLHAVPLHAAVTDAFLIRRHETTFAEWIAYLDALPADRRETALPGVGVGGFEGGMTLRTGPDGRRVLTFKPANREYTAVEGSPMEFPTRPVRATQDWLRFPVSGITAAQAGAYAAWLASTSRVPGARLCTEMEWERAARGADTRLFPAGNVLPPEDANYDATYRKDPTAMGPDEVGSHPASRSPFGLDDMAGNVWEWTVSSVEPNGHAARGGSFYFDANTARVMNRETPEASFRDVSVGFRVCADAPALRRTCANGQAPCAGMAQPGPGDAPEAP